MLSDKTDSSISFIQCLILGSLSNVAGLFHILKVNFSELMYFTKTLSLYS